MKKRTIACANVTFGYEKGYYQIFDCALCTKSGNLISLAPNRLHAYSTFSAMYDSVLNIIDQNGFKVPCFNEFGATCYLINFVDVFNEHYIFKRYLYNGIKYKGGMK